MTSADVRWVLVEGMTAEGATICRGTADFDTLDEVLAAVEENRLHAMRSADLSMRNVDAVYNAKIHAGEQVIAETFILSVVTAMTTKTFNKVVANLGWKDLQFPTLVRAGDTIYVESEILGKRESQSRPAQAVLHVRTRAANQHGAEVCSFERRLLIYKRGLGPYEAAGY